MWAHLFWRGAEFRGFMWKCIFLVYVCACACACTRTLCKSIFVCFATSLDILFGSTDRKAVKCDLNILCLHLFPPFSSPSLFLMLPHFPLISFSSPSITISLGASMFLCFWWLVCPHPPSKIISLSLCTVFVHIIKPFLLVCLTNICENQRVFRLLRYHPHGTLRTVCTMCSYFVFAQHTLLHCGTSYLLWFWYYYTFLSLINF